MLLTNEQKKEALAIIEELERRKRYFKLESYKPQKKQILYHNSVKPDRCLGAGNQLGKTFAASMDIAMHMTGLYPDWWEGIRFKKPPVFWIAGATIELVRDSIQKLLLGDWQDESALGSGSIPRHLLLHQAKRVGTQGAIDSFVVKHTSGGQSKATFKSYDMGRFKFQAATLDGIYFDEEPPADIYSEGRTRTNKGQNGNRVSLTFTPLLGMTEVVMQFYQDPAAHQELIQFTIEEAEHYTEEEKQAIISSYPEHEREARAKGIPILGSGRIFPVPEELIKEPHIHIIPEHWAKINGLDFGYDHPSAGVQIAWDRENDVIHLVRGIRVKGQSDIAMPALMGVTMKKWGEEVPTAWPHDGLQHDKGSGKQLAKQYSDAGLNMLEDHATHEAGGFGVEAGIQEMLERMRTGRLKIDETITDWFEEFRLYHRKDGKIVKLQDDLISATRYAIMMKRFAESDAEMSINSAQTINFMTDFS
jgi:phage terminase large subunit-like protein